MADKRKTEMRAAIWRCHKHIPCKISGEVFLETDRKRDTKIRMRFRETEVDFQKLKILMNRAFRQKQGKIVDLQCNINLFT